MVTFRQSADEPEYSYILEQKPIALNDYYYNPDLGNFCSIQIALHPAQLSYQFQVVVATNNLKYKNIYKEKL